MIIDGKDLILGRAVTVIAKKLLEGEQIELVNCEKMIITGKKDFILKKYKERIEKGSKHHGPFYPKRPERIVKRAIRGMLPHQTETGNKALKRVKCYISLPEKIKNQKFETIESAHKKRLKIIDYLTVEQIAKHLGYKI